MAKLYLKTLICIILVLWLYYFIFVFSKKINNYQVRESFTPIINSIYNPYKRKFNKIYERFVNPIKETPSLIMNKFYIIIFYR